MGKSHSQWVFSSIELSLSFLTCKSYTEIAFVVRMMETFVKCPEESTSVGLGKGFPGHIDSRFSGSHSSR